MAIPIYCIACDISSLSEYNTDLHKMWMCNNTACNYRITFSDIFCVEKFNKFDYKIYNILNMKNNANESAIIINDNATYIQNSYIKPNISKLEMQKLIILL